MEVTSSPKTGNTKSSNPRPGFGSDTTFLA
ncbi:hypothetical protein CCACVL1_13525 [Corchorus capsularis]|uniref:Uncharacterized protein n=1 Tax=Corchorus capsularis TaxID=210143 RepID=A0A1R3IAQ4_COCAP|nr:hypothetical protein CCACVL1_13525 [Corchorus capsularis]